MRQLRLGDICAYKTKRGYRIVQWAYQHAKMGKYVKVFPGFYREKPNDLSSILHGECSYIITFNMSNLVKEGVLEFWGNDQDCIQEPFPEYDIEFRKCGNQFLYRISNSLRHQENEKFIGDPSGRIIPNKYKDLRLLNLVPHPIQFLYLLSSDFDLNHFDLFWPDEDELVALQQKYNHLM